MTSGMFLVLIYLFFTLFTFIACDYKVSVYADVNLSENSGLTIFYIVPRISVTGCKENCISRKRCRFINYFTLANTCFLLGVKDSASLSPNDALGKLKEGPGYLFGMKSEWGLGETEACDACPDLGPCSDGSITPNSTSLSSSACESSGCIVPMLDVNSVVYGTQYTPSNSVKHLCRTDYVNTETTNNIAFCQGNGTWTKASITCIYDCGTMEIANGQFTAISGTLHGSEATIACHTGYRLSGSRSITCTENGWDGSATCTWIDCGDPTPANGFSDSNVYANGSVVTISCRSGMTVSGSNTITCMEDGTWTDSPTCVCPGTQEQYGLSCYEVVTTTKKWSDAKLNCESKGGHLADVKSSGQQSFIKELIISSGSTGSLWLGGNDYGREGQFRWSDDTQVSSGYTYWQPGQPDDSSGGEDCMDLITVSSFNYRWNDNICSYRFRSICQIDL